MALPSFPPIDASNYRWHQAPEPGLWQRRACGIENLDGLEGPNKKGHNDFCIAVTSRFHDQHVTLGQLDRALKQVWRRTRFHHPQIACTPVWRNGQLFLTYRPPADDEEAWRWVECSVKLELSRRNSMEVQSGIEENRRAAGSSVQSSDAASVHIIAPLSTINGRICNSDIIFMFHLNHIFLDGSGAYKLIGLVLEDLAIELSSPTRIQEDFTWKNSIRNLTPAFIEILSSDQHLSGPSYETALQKALMDSTASQASWGLKPKGAVNAIARNIFHLFSVDETDYIKSAAKTAGFNITHLTHAAVFLVGLKSNPPSTTKEMNTAANMAPFIASYFAIDDRQSIDEKFPHHRTRYLANCHGHGNVKVNNITNCVLGPKATRDELCWTLMYMAMRIKNCYDDCMRRPCRVSAGLAFMEILAGVLASNPPLGTQMTTPLLVSDGIYDRWIAPQIAHPHTQTPYITNSDVRLYANNYQSFPSFHIAAFRSRCLLSVQYDDGFYPQEEMAGYLRHVAEMMLVFAGMRGDNKSML